MAQSPVCSKVCYWEVTTLNSNRNGFLKQGEYVSSSKKVGKAVAFSSVSSILGSLWDERHEEGDDE